MKLADVLSGVHLVNQSNHVFNDNIRADNNRDRLSLHTVGGFPRGSIAVYPRPVCKRLKLSQLYNFFLWQLVLYTEFHVLHNELLFYKDSRAVYCRVSVFFTFFLSLFTVVSTTSTTVTKCWGRGPCYSNHSEDSVLITLFKNGHTEILPCLFRTLINVIIIDHFIYKGK